MGGNIPNNLIENDSSSFIKNQEELQEMLSNIFPFTLHVQFKDGAIPLIKRHVKSLENFDLLPAMKAHIRSSLEQIVVSDLIKGKTGLISVDYTKKQEIVFGIDIEYHKRFFTLEDAFSQLQNILWIHNVNEKIVYYSGKIYKAVDSLTFDLLKTLGYECVGVEINRLEQLSKNCDEIFATSNAQYLIEIEGKSGEVYNKLHECFEKL